MVWVRGWLCKLQKGCTQLTTASDKVYQLLAHVRWFSPDTPASSVTKSGRHDIAEMLLKVALNIKIQSISAVDRGFEPKTIKLVFASTSIKHTVFKSKDWLVWNHNHELSDMWTVVQ
jgi:hypothetical protein